MRRIKRVSKSAYLAGKEWGWGEFECTHGYGVFNGDYPTTHGYIAGDHIEVIGVMGGDETFWKYDTEAASHAERYCGYKIIRDIDGIDAVFIDTPENRKSILAQLQNKRRIL